MKKVININFQGVVVPIEETAYEILKRYISDLQDYFADEEGKDEIINDIEGRIGELFQNRIKEGVSCITDDDVNHIIDNMGRIKDFEEADSEKNTSEKKEKNDGTENSPRWRRYKSGQIFRNKADKILGGVCSGIAVYLGVDPWLVRILFILSGVGLLAYIVLWIFLPERDAAGDPTQKKLYRNPDDRIIAGICGGIGSYFNINPWLPRAIFLIPFISFFFRWNTLGFWSFPHFFRFTFSPGMTIMYVLLWILIPEAKTRSEKMQMKGEKVDLNSIRESVTKEINEAGERVSTMGKQAEGFIKKQFSQTKTATATSRALSGLFSVIVTLVKIFLYIIAGAVIFAILVSLLAIAMAGMAVFPLKDFFIPDGWPNFLAWVTLICLIIVPVVGIIAFVIRRIIRRKPRNSYVQNTSIVLWVVGWISLGILIYQVKNEFRYTSTLGEQIVPLSDTSTGFIELMPERSAINLLQNRFSSDFFNDFGWGNDSLDIPNIRVRVFKATDRKLSVKYVKMSNGATRDQANSFAADIPFSIRQEGGSLFFNNYISISKNDKFRNQMVELALFVPVGDHFIIHKNLFGNGGMKVHLFGRQNNLYLWDDQQTQGYHFSSGKEYIMEEDGPHRIPDDDDTNSNSPDTGEKYRYKDRNRMDSLKNEQEKQLQKMDKTIDSVKKAREQVLKRMRDSLTEVRDRVSRQLNDLNK